MRLRLFRAAAAAAYLCVVSAAGSSAAAPTHSLAEDARAFGARQAVRSVDISPSGTKLLYIAAGHGGASLLEYVDIATKASKAVAGSDGNPETLYWCAFASDTQMVCKFGGTQRIDSDVAGFSRVVAIPADGSKVKELGQPANYYNPVGRQYDGDILDWLPDSPGSVMVQRTYVAERTRLGSNIRDSREGLGVYEVDLATLKASQVEAPRPGIDGYMTDGRGDVRIMEIAATTGEEQALTGIIHYKYRATKSKEWQPLIDYDLRTEQGAVPIAVEAESDSAFMLQKVHGRDALFRTRLDGSGSSTLIAANDKVDIDGVVRIGHGQRVIGYTYATEGREIIYFDPEFKQLSASLSAALPGHPAITFEGASADGSKLVVLASSDTNPGTFYLFDKRTKHLDEVAPVRPELDRRTLAEVRPVLIPAPDGVQIPAYLTLPPNGPAKNLPAIVLPHGGPSARDEWGFDWLSQFLAARGYAVIQPNYRGSAGYGEQWEGANGFKEWEKAIADISASARFLVAQGIADPKRLAILGWSYGGYAALQSAAVQPDLYKAVVAIAPVTDLSLLKLQYENFSNWRLVNEEIGSGDHVAAGSPLRRAESIKAPVLLVHGDLDANVAILHSEKMLDALKDAGKQAELLRFKGLDHGLNDSDARTQMLTRIGQFLDAEIGH
ncbi:MAG TPA: S9 family peptidase [Sphingomicrobium sp.]|nr:S9 family peptidase [Sphingomicrobium sp.]